MSFSSRRRNYLLTPHRRDGLIECMKGMLMHSFVLDALDTTGADTFSHFEVLIDEHRRMTRQLLAEQNAASASGGGLAAVELDPNVVVPSRLKRLEPSVGTFYTRLPLRRAFEAYNAKYGVTKRRYICVSFNEIRHILNLAQIIAMIRPDGKEGGLIGGFEGMTVVPRPVPLPSNEDDRQGIGSMTRMEYRTERQSETDERALEAWASMGETTPRIEGAKGVNDEGTGDSGDEEGAKGSGDEKQRSNPTARGSPRNLLEPSQRSDTCIIEETLSQLPEKSTLPGPRLICFDGDQTLYSDGSNFEGNPKLAKYLYLLLRYGVTVAVVTAAGYEYQASKYELRLSGLLDYFKDRGLGTDDLERFYIFGGECNYLLRLGDDYRLHAVREDGPGGWVTSTRHIAEGPGNWRETDVAAVLDRAEACFRSSASEQNMRARVIRKRRSVGLVPRASDEKIPREALDETVLRIQTELEGGVSGPLTSLPFCAFNGGRDAWVDVGNKRVGVQVLQSYLGVPPEATLHIGDQFLTTGNDFAARSVCPCVWITSPDETTYVLKSILRLGGVPLMALSNTKEMGGKVSGEGDARAEHEAVGERGDNKKVDFEEAGRRSSRVVMDVYTGEYVKKMTN